MVGTIFDGLFIIGLVALPLDLMGWVHVPSILGLWFALAGVYEIGVMLTQDKNYYPPV